jgi:hypothetical protein
MMLTNILTIDSDDLECYVYRDKPHHANNNAPNYTISPWTYNNNEEPYYYDRHYSSTGTESNTDGCESAAAYNSNKEKYSTRRPVLRSTVSEIPHHHLMRNQKKFNNRPSFSKHYYYNPSEDEEFTPLVRSRPLRRRKGTSSHGSHSGSGGKR